MAEIFLDVRESHRRSAFLVMVQCLVEDRKVHSAHGAHHLFSFLLTPAKGYQLAGRNDLLVFLPWSRFGRFWTQRPKTQTVCLSI